MLQQKGMVPHGHRGYGRDIGLIVHMSASTRLGPDPNNKVMVCSVEEALKMGADAVSVHINIGSETESDQLQALSQTAKSCTEWGMPLLAMMYPRGKAIKNPHDPEVVALAARAGAELGADVIKTNYTGRPGHVQDGGPGLSGTGDHRRRPEDEVGSGCPGDRRGGNGRRGKRSRHWQKRFSA